MKKVTSCGGKLFVYGFSMVTDYCCKTDGVLLKENSIEVVLAADVNIRLINNSDIVDNFIH